MSVLAQSMPPSLTTATNRRVGEARGSSTKVGAPESPKQTRLGKRHDAQK
jgi:hypothetical protein